MSNRGLRGNVMVNQKLQHHGSWAGLVRPRRSSWRASAGAAMHRHRPGFDALESRRLLTSGVSTFPIRPQGQGSVRVALGADNNLWFTMASNNIGMMSPTTRVTTQFPIPTVGSGASDMTPGPDGNLWF